MFLLSLRLYGNGTERVGLCWPGWCILCCAAWSAAAPGVTRVGDMGLRICVWYGDVPYQRFAFGPREESGAVRTFVMFHRQVDWQLFCWRYLRSLNGLPDDIIHVAVALLSGAGLENLGF